MPENVNFDKIGISSFSSKYTEFDLGNKVTDSIYFVSRQRIAKSHPDWVVKTIEYDRAALLAKSGMETGFRSARAREAFSDLARNNDLDAIFVVRAFADNADSLQPGFAGNNLREGLNVQVKNNNFTSEARLVFRANLKLAIIGKNGDLMAVGAIPAKLDKVEEREPDDYDVSDNMKHNHRPEVLAKVGPEVVADLTRRLNRCFDSLGFVEGSNPESQHVNIVPQAEAVTETAEKSPARITPATDTFEQCFSNCRKYTDRTKEQCFDACNK